MISQVLPAANSARKGPTIQMPDQLTILGLESSCDDTAAAVVRGAPDDRADIMSSVVLGQADLHGEFGGVVPELAARAHAEKIDICVEAALAKAGIGLSDVDGVAVTAGPGLIGGVLSGVMCAKGLATASRKPLIGVNHLAGHALTPRMTDAIVYPYLMLLVSGGHCQFLIVHGCDEFTRLGGTIDDAPGEAFDKSARLLGLTQPGGPAVEHAAKSGDPARFRFPRPLIDRQNCDMSYSGLKTAVRRARDEIIAQNGGLTEVDQADLCAGFQAAVADVMAAKSEMACEAFTAQTGLSRGVLAVAGGVAANLTIREALVQSATNSGFEFVAPPLIYCTDNAAMIAWAGLERMAAGQTDDMSLAARPRWPLDPNAAPMLGSGKRGAKA